MRTRERVLTARLIEKIKKNPEYAEKIGISQEIQNRRTKEEIRR